MKASAASAVWVALAAAAARAAVWARAVLAVRAAVWARAFFAVRAAPAVSKVRTEKWARAVPPAVRMMK